MGYFVHYQIATSGPELPAQLWQELFHFQGAHFQFGDYTTFVLLMLCSFALIITSIIYSVVITRLRKFGSVVLPSKLGVFFGVYTVTFVGLILAVLVFLIYPNHMMMANKISSPNCKQVEGVVRDLTFSKGVVQRAHTFDKAVFKLDEAYPPHPAYRDKAVVVTTSSPFFDNPWDPQIANGKKLRVWILQESTHAPVVLRVDVAK